MRHSVASRPLLTLLAAGLLCIFSARPALRLTEDSIWASYERQQRLQPRFSRSSQDQIVAWAISVESAHLRRERLQDSFLNENFPLEIVNAVDGRYPLPETEAHEYISEAHLVSANTSERAHIIKKGQRISANPLLLRVVSLSYRS